MGPAECHFGKEKGITGSEPMIEKKQSKEPISYSSGGLCGGKERGQGGRWLVIYILASTQRGNDFGGWECVREW